MQNWLWPTPLYALLFYVRRPFKPELQMVTLRCWPDCSCVCKATELAPSDFLK